MPGHGLRFPQQPPEQPQAPREPFRVSFQTRNAKAASAKPTTTQPCPPMGCTSSSPT